MAHTARPRTPRSRLRVGLFLPAALTLVAAVHAQCDPPEWLPGGAIPGVSGTVVQGSWPLGFVLAACHWDPDGPGPLGTWLVVGGLFAHAGAGRAQNLAAFDGTSWFELGGGVDDIVRDLAVLPDGRLVVAGDFETVGTDLALHIAAFDGHVWSSLGRGVTGQVAAVLVHSSGDLIVGGNLTGAGDVPAAGVARWDGAAWHALDSGVRSGPYAGGVFGVSELPGGDLVFAGSFDRAGGVPANHVVRVRLGPVGGPSTWTPLGAGLDDYALTCAVLGNGDVVVGGVFSAAGGVPSTQYLARWDGTAWSAFGVGVERYVIDLAPLPNGELAVAGAFDFAGGVPVRGLARWDGALWHAFGGFESQHDAYFQTQVALVTVEPSGTLLVGGTLDGGIVRYDGVAWRKLGTGFDAPIRHFAVGDAGELFAAGSFDQAMDTAAHQVARFDGAVWSALGAGLDGEVTALAAGTGGELFVAIRKVLASGLVLGRTMHWDGAAWTIQSVGVTLTALARGPGGALYGAGNDAFGYGVFQWVNGAWTRLGNGFTRPSEFPWFGALLALPNGDLLVGGSFDGVGGVPMGNVARWDGAQWSALGGGLGDVTGDQAVTSFALLPNGDIAAGGPFAYDPTGATLYAGIARFDGVAWHPYGNGIAFHGVTDLAVLADGRLVAALAYPSSIVTFDGTAWVPATPRIEGAPYALALLPNGDLAVGGELLVVGGRSSARFALFGCGQVGASTCPGVINSTGTSAELRALGSRFVATNDVRLVSRSLPPEALCLALASRAGGLVANPGGSAGNLCLGGGVGRYVEPGQVLPAGPDGRYELALDLTRTPTSLGPVAVTAGETWRFQVWYRDVAPGGATSNFTNGLAIPFL